MHGEYPQSKRFIGVLKELISLCSPFMRIAITGSGMITLLNYIRVWPTNGFRFLDAARIISLGETPSDEISARMADQIVTAYRSICFEESVRDSVTSELILQHIDTHSRFLTRRPAVVAFTCQLMGDAGTGTIDEVIRLAAKAMASKIEIESEVDIACVLCTFADRLDIKLAFLAYANGNTAAFDYLKEARDCDELFPKLLLPLCDPVSRQFLPPYAHLFNKLIDSFGNILSPRFPLPFDFSYGLRESFTFYFQNFKNLSADLVLCQHISTAVFDFLYSRDIGEIDPATGELIRKISNCHHARNCPQIWNLISNNQATSAIFAQFQKAFSNPAQHADYDCKFGLVLLTAIRCTAYHVQFAGTVLDGFGWPIGLLESLFQTANEALVQHSPSFVLGSAGAPIPKPPA